MAAGGAHVVGQLQLAAIRAFLELLGLERMMAAAHVPLRRRGFSLGDSHSGTCVISKKLATICADFNGFTRGGGRIVANRGSYSA
jgi:hypothetical protein